VKNRSDIRVRFAPSPTGNLHVGGLRTALYNYLFARKSHGTFILRIEDTDRSRYVEGAVEGLIETLRWSGLEFDEGPGKKGASGPYVQSERLATYRSHAEELLAAGRAYRCFCTPERLEEMRREREKAKLPPKYDRRCLNLGSAEIKEHLDKGSPFVVRMKVPDSKPVRFHDIIRGDVEFSSDMLDDQVLVKSDGYPTYHLANVVDDHLMNVSHVIRGEEWLSSTPKHVLLYGYFGWELPEFAHLPLLLNPDRSKLSKRQGDVAVEDYRAKGYLREALVNFVALLGWNPGTEQEYFTLEELVGQFSLDRVNKAGAIFNVEKLNWLNAEHLRRKSDNELLAILREQLAGSKFAAGDFSDAFLLKVIEAMKPRVSFPKDFVELGSYFFDAPSAYDQEVVRKRWNRDTPAQLAKLSVEFSSMAGAAASDFEAALTSAAEKLGTGNGTLIHAVRLALSGVGGGPGVYELLSILGKEESLKRIQSAIERIHV
jgi:glutamyl-tRNA synthetase